MNMEEELILKQPSDRRLGDNSALPPGPPGAEFDTVDFDTKNPPVKAPVVDKESSISERASKRRSPSPSATVRKRKSPSRGRRSPSSPVRSRGRRSPSPRRNRYRDYSPDRRPRYGGRRSPDRRRSPPRRGGARDRYRGRGRSSSRSISRSPTPPRRVGGSGSGRWSPKKKPNSPSQPPPNLPRQLSQPPPTTNQPPPQYGVMAPPPPQLYSEAYGPPPGYSQYGVPPPQSAFVQPNEAYVAMQAQGAGFSTAYPPPGSWGVDAYGQQQWMPPPTQIQQMPPPQQQQQPPPPPLVVQPTNQQQMPPSMPPPNSTSAAVTNKLGNNLGIDAPGTLEANSQHDAVAQEAENQRDELKKQRTSYLKKTAVLKKELKMLKEQRKELHSGGAPASPTTKGFIDENEKLQNQIQKKLSTIENVIDMLTGIIGEENLEKDDQIEDDDILKEAALSSLQKPLTTEHGSSQIVHAATAAVPYKKKTRSSSSSSDSSSGTSTSSSSDSSSSDAEQPTNKDEEEDDSSPERLKKKVIESMRNKDKDARSKQDQKGPNRKERFNYVFYDPEMHWCQTCNVFPKTAKDYLNHLHTKNHMDRESIETPWHTDMVTDQFPTHENAPTKRTPIRGLTFFVPATAWFCKLCNIWMGDLHCASTHLKSQLHASRYNAFLEENPHYEVNWLADRQIVLNEQKPSLPQQITSVSTTAGERKKNKKDDDKTSKKRKKKSDKKQKKKKKKSTKKRKKDSESSSSTSSESSSTTDSDEPKKKKMSAVEIKDLDNPNPGVSIRLSMRKQESIKSDEVAPPPPPQLKLKQPSPVSQIPPAGKWTVVQEGMRNKDGEKPQDTDDSIIQQWNTVQPVISESEKKLLEQLKGKLKNKSKDEQQQIKSTTVQKSENDKENREREKDKDRERDRGEEGRSARSDRRDKDAGNRGKDDRDRDRERDRDRDRARTSRRSRTRSPTRSRSRGRDYRRNVRRSRSRSRGRISPRGWRNRNRRIDRSRSRSLRRRSRSPYDRRRRNSRSRSLSNSRSGTSSRVEKPIVRQAEFRPRVPEKDKDKEKKASENKDKKDKTKPKTSSSSSTTTSTPANSAGKKLPFIGKMPVFKKQTSGAPGEMGEKRPDELQAQQAFMYPMDATAAFSRPPAPTAAQIQMAMMEDAYGNAPPFHPDAGMMVDYDDLMPDPVQFVNIMGQAPPPPPPQSSDDDKDMLPPGIDVEESEEFVPKPITEGPPPGKGPLPKDLEDALNIIFPGEKKPGEYEEGELEKIKAKGETQIINDEVVMQPEELAKDGIHLVTFEETSQLGLDDASQMSMNEPLVFNRPPSNPTTTAAIISTDMELEDANSQPRMDINIEIVPPPPPVTEEEICLHEIKMPEEIDIAPPMPAQTDKVEIETKETNNMPEDTDDIPIPPELDNNKTDIIKSSPKEDTAKEENNEELMHTIVDIDLADIPQPPPSPTESEKNRRQEELDDLAMLGIDADDMAAQCM